MSKLKRRLNLTLRRVNQNLPLGCPWRDGEPCLGVPPILTTVFRPCVEPRRLSGAQVVPQPLNCSLFQSGTLAVATPSSMSILSDKTGRKTMDGLEPGPSERMDGIAHPGESAPELAPYPLDASMFLPPDAAAQASAKSPTPVQDDLALSHPSSTEFPEVTDDLELLPEEAPETNAWGTLHSQPQPFTGGAQQSAVIDILGPPPTELGLSAEAGSAAASLGAHPAHGTVTSAPVAPQPHPPHHAEVQPVAAPCAPALEFPAEVDSAAPGSTLGLPGLYGPGSGSAVVTSVAPPPLPQATQLSAAPSHGVSPAFAAPSDPTAVSDPSTGPSSGLPVPLNAGAPLLAHAEPIDNSIGAALPSFVGSAQPHSVSQVLEPSGDDIAPALPHPETAASEPSRLAGLEAGATPVDTGAVEAVPVSTGAMSVNAPAVEAGLVNTVALPAVAVDAAAVDAMAVDPPSPEPEPTPRVRDPLYEPPEGSSAVVCGVCRKWFGTASALRAHYKSDMHQSVIYELWDMMEEDDPRFLVSVLSSVALSLTRETRTLTVESIHGAGAGWRERQRGRARRHGGRQGLPASGVGGVVGRGLLADLCHRRVHPDTRRARLGQARA